MGVLLDLDLEVAMRREVRLLAGPSDDVGTDFRFGDAVVSRC